MFRILIPIALLATFVCWLSYRLLVRKDARKQLGTVAFAGFFFGIWVLIYFLILN